MAQAETEGLKHWTQLMHSICGPADRRSRSVQSNKGFGLPKTCRWHKKGVFVKAIWGSPRAKHSRSFLQIKAGAKELELKASA